jgi:hypothetical protein
MDQSIIKALHFLSADTTADQTDSIRTSLYRLDAYEADIEIAKITFPPEKKPMPISVLNNCSLKYALSDESLEDLSEIEEIFQMADENGYSNQQKDRLLEIAGHPETGYAPYMARSILELYGENYAPYFPAVESRTDQFVKKTEGLTGITVRPNPSDENVYFTLPGARGSLDISNLQGNIIINVLFNEHFNWEVSTVQKTG